MRSWSSRLLLANSPPLPYRMMGHRYYDPSSGRFISRDPIGQDGGSNEYGFTDNNPVMRHDDVGLDWAYNPNATVETATAADWAHVALMFNAAFVSAITDGNYDGGKFRCETGWEIAKTTMNYVWAIMQTVETDGFSEAGAAADEADEAALSGCNILCLTGGTPVQMADGTTKSIEQVQIGEFVLARNQQTGQEEPKRVSATISRRAPDLVTVTLADSRTGETEAITATPDHPFYVEGSGWTTAGTLTKGMSIATHDGSPLTVDSLTWQRDEKSGFAVYNMTVEDDHDYIVGGLNGGIWVHNVCNEYDIVPYKTPAPGFQKHHGFMDVWAKSQYGRRGYSSGNAPSVVLTVGAHDATRVEFNAWRKGTTGSVTGFVDWASMSESEAQSISERLFDAANVPANVRSNYYDAFQVYINGLR